MNQPEIAAEFLRLWVETCGRRKAVLLRDWSNLPFFTAHVLTEPDCVIEAIANRLHWRCYCGYYSLDAILFAESDLVPQIPVGTTWVRRIRVAFEHENNFYSGLFQEVSHLLITACDLRVLVSYPGNPDELEIQLGYLHSIINGAAHPDQIASDGAFLFIAGWPRIEADVMEWWGYVYERAGWRKL